MAESTFATEKPFDFEQKNAPVTPPADTTSIPEMDSTGQPLANPPSDSIPQTNGDSTAHPHFLGLHPALSNEMPPDPSAATLTSLASETADVDLENPVEHVTQGIQPLADFLPEQRENPTEAPDPTATATVPPTIEQPISDVREEPTDLPPVLDSGIEQANQEAVQHNSTIESMIQEPAQPVGETAMDTSAVDAPADVVAAVEPIPAAAPPDEQTVEEAAAEPAVDENADGTQAEDVKLAPSTIDVAPPGTAPISEDTEMAEAPAVPTTNGLVRPREEDESEEPASKRTKTDEQPELDSAVDFKKPDLPSLSTDASTIRADETPTTATEAAALESVDAGPISPEQDRYLRELLRRAKKTKDALPFLAPVDYVALNIPTYPDVVKEPMDLGTIESKLKGGQYSSVDGMVRDINLMADNAMLFNGASHAVTYSGSNTRQYLMKSIKTGLPRKGAASASAPAPKPVKEKAKPEPRPSMPRRESRAVAQSPAGSARSPGAETFALQPDGTPLIRRDSVAIDGRPKREIHRPQPKDLPYQTTRPKTKKHATELKFCAHVLKELYKRDHASFAYAFYDPVDPVALNIPSYHKIIKRPMDLGTVNSNLKNGQYSNGKEFKADVELIFTNCYKFNPSTEVVHGWGKKLEEVFKSEWSKKDEWIREHSTPDTRSDEEEEDEEDDEEEEEENTGNIDASRLAAIQAQINALSAEMTNLVSGAQAGNRRSPSEKPTKKSKKGDNAPGKKTKRSSSIAPAAAPAAKPAKAKKPAKIPKLSQDQKREVSEGIGNLDDAGMRKAVQIIRNGVPSLQNVNDDELELDIDEIPDAVVYDLYKFVRSLRPKTARTSTVVDDDVPDDGEFQDEDDDFKPPARARTGASTSGSGGRKKNKPMTATAQEAKIQEIKSKLSAFESAGGVEAEMVHNAQAAMQAQTASASPEVEDEDEDDDGSESEEE